MTVRRSIQKALLKIRRAALSMFPIQPAGTFYSVVENVVMDPTDFIASNTQSESKNVRRKVHMTKPAAANYAQYRSPAEISRDEIYDAHVAGDCTWETCEFCIAELEAISRFVDEELDDDQRCKHCGSMDFERNGDVERCAVCGR